MKRTKWIVSGLAIAIAVAVVWNAIYLPSDLIESGQVSVKQDFKVTTSQLGFSALYFTENQGQFNEDVLFRAKTGRATVWLQRDAVTYQFTRKIKLDEEIDKVSADDPILGIETKSDQSFMREQLAIKTSFVGASDNVMVSGLNQMDGISNFFKGRDKSNWHTNVANYEAVRYNEIYPGIDLKYYDNGQNLEHDFIVSTSGDASQIAVTCEGINSLTINKKGELVFDTEWGDFVGTTPRIYQSIAGKEVAVEGKYVLYDDFTYGFKLDNYNPEYSVVIDPTQEVYYASYFGGEDEDEGWDVKVDDCGYAYIVGYTDSDSLPTTSGVYQTGFNGDVDVFVAKFNTKRFGTNSLAFSTYIGGDSIDNGYGLDIDDDGDVYITGATQSSDFPTFPSTAFDTVYDGGEDGFLVKLNSTGTSLIYSTLFGTSATKQLGYEVAVHPNERASVVGFATNTGLQCKNGFDCTEVLGYGFLLQFGKDGDSLVYATYITGHDTEIPKYTYATSIAVQDNNAAFVTGITNQNSFPTPNGFDTTLGGGLDGFLVKIDPTKTGDSSLIYGTMIGGSGTDYGSDIFVDENGIAYVVGPTKSSDFPDTNAYDNTLGGTWDGFLTKISSNGDSLLFGSYIGGSSDDSATGVAVLSDGSVYVALQTRSTTDTKFKVVNAIHSDTLGGLDIYVAKFNSDLDDLDFASYFGGSDNDEVYALTALDDNNVYLISETSSSDFDTTTTGYATTLWGDEDAHLLRIAAPDASLCLRGDMDDTGIIDRGDLNYIIAFIFSGGPEPDSCKGDVNNDDKLDVLDLTALNGWLTTCTGINATACDCN